MIAVAISEPTTVLTDYLLAGAAFVFAWRLLKASAQAGFPGSVVRALWAGAFATGGAAALVGGTAHGFPAALGPSLHPILRQCALLFASVAGALLLAAAGLAVLRGRALRAALGVVLVKLAVELVVISYSGLTRHAVIAGASSVAGLLMLVVLHARDDITPLASLAPGLVLAGAALGLQAARLSPHAHFNHNDLCHVLLTAALYPIYRAGLHLGATGLTSGQVLD